MRALRRAASSPGAAGLRRSHVALVLALFGCALSALTAPRAAEAQAPERTGALILGVSSYDLSGTGTRPVLGIRVGVPLRGPFLVEPGVTYFKYRDQGSARRHHVIPEMHLQVERSGGRLSPYLGAGVGVSWVTSEGESATDLTLSGVAGLRLRIGGGWFLVTEFRLRAIDPWTGSMADFGLGMAQRI